MRLRGWQESDGLSSPTHLPGTQSNNQSVILTGAGPAGGSGRIRLSTEAWTVSRSIALLYVTGP